MKIQIIFKGPKSCMITVSMDVDPVEFNNLSNDFNHYKREYCPSFGFYNYYLPSQNGRMTVDCMRIQFKDIFSIRSVNG
jgi:hypothetical protein